MTASASRAVRLAAAATLTLVLAACGGSSGGGAASSATATSGSGGSSASSAATGAQITIASFAFGSPLTVKAGATVSVKNSDSVSHTVTADDGKSFDVSVDANGTATFTAPSTPGTYAYHCTIHPDMHGTLVVTA